MTMELERTAEPAPHVHVPGYQARDFEVVDYRMSELAGTGLAFRGPFPDTLGEPGSYFACLGAAQTLGCFCEHPYPSLVAREIGLPALNLGYGGAGPEFFVRQEALLPYINRARFVVLQVMSARSQSNSYYECGGLEYVTLRDGGRRLGAYNAFDELVRGPRFVQRLPLPPRIRRTVANALLRPDPRVPGLVAELQEAWLASCLTLLERITVPVVLLWFSRRAPAYTQRYGTAVMTLGEFPHLVNEAMLARLRPACAGYAECVTVRGSPQTLYSRFTGEPTSVRPSDDRKDLDRDRWRKNGYYPSPEMHEDAAAALLPVLEATAGLTRRE